MVSQDIDTDVEVEIEEGVTTMLSRGEGGIRVRGPTRFVESADPHITIYVGHGGEPIEYDDGSESTPGDFAQAVVRLSLGQAALLSGALGDALDEEPDTIIKDWEHENGGDEP